MYIVKITKEINNQGIQTAVLTLYVENFVLPLVESDRWSSESNAILVNTFVTLVNGEDTISIKAVRNCRHIKKKVQKLQA